MSCHIRRSYDELSRSNLDVHLNRRSHVPISSRAQPLLCYFLFGVDKRLRIRFPSPVSYLYHIKTPCKVTYPLDDRGVVLLRGSNLDDSGADSNGAGKTTLAMSALWALAGVFDTRCKWFVKPDTDSLPGRFFSVDDLSFFFEKFFDGLKNIYIKMLTLTIHRASATVKPLSVWTL